MSNEIEKSFGTADTEQTYSVIRNSVISAQNKIYSAVNSAMVTAYWETITFSTVLILNVLKLFGGKQTKNCSPQKSFRGL